MKEFIPAFSFKFRGKASIPSLSSWPGYETFLSRFTITRCAGYILFLDTYPDNLTHLSAA